MLPKYKITIVGAGYVGMSLGALISQKHLVTILDTDKIRVDKINAHKSTIPDPEIEKILSSKDLKITATLCSESAFTDANFIIIATPTDYDFETNKFDTSSVDLVIKNILKINQNCLIVIKSTIPVGHTDYLRKLHSTERIIYSPEFLREGNAVYDNLYPSRIIIGDHTVNAKKFANILKTIALKENIETLFVESKEAECIKLFSNTYLAMRVSFFNELDSFALINKLDTKKIIQGVCLDERIREGYNNPSFGYGGYCLPKDTKQLLANYENIPQNIIQAIVCSNATRKDFIANEILKFKPKTVGIFRLVMKKDSGNFRFSAIQGIMKRIKGKGINVVVFEPELKNDYFFGSKVLTDLQDFKKVSDLIVTNRRSEQLSDVWHKCFSRDIFGEN